MWLFAALVLCLCAHTLKAQAPADSPELFRAKQALSRIQILVAEGGLPPKRLEQAREAVAEAEDQAALHRTLYGTVEVQHLTEALTTQMIEAATRLMARQQTRLDATRDLIEQGVLARTELTPLLEELDMRRKTLQLAESRQRLWSQLLEMAQAEEQRLAQMEADRSTSTLDELPGAGLIPQTHLAALEKDYRDTFNRPLPVSARGDTAFHRTLGFDHTGRLDVGLNPDSAEGQWLRGWLDRFRIPYLAFRRAIRGVSSAPHIHIGPPSNRIRSAD